ncbi:hypothetical protein ANN_14568, partial [Periplaneta americana]
SKIVWNPFPTAQAYNYNNYNNNNLSGGLSGLANTLNTGLSNGLTTSSLSESIGDLVDHFSELNLSFERKPTKRPPPAYLCHLCFKKGHYIKDCPQGLESNGLHQILVYADDVDMLGENPQTIRRNTGILLQASKEIDLEVNPEKTKVMIMSRDRNIIRNGNIIANLSVEE